MEGARCGGASPLPWGMGGDQAARSGGGMGEVLVAGLMVSEGKVRGTGKR